MSLDYCEEENEERERIIGTLPPGVTGYVVAVTVRGKRRYSLGRGSYRAHLDPPAKCPTWTSNPRKAFLFVRGTEFRHGPIRFATPKQFAEAHAETFHDAAKVYRRKSATPLPGEEPK